VSTSNPVQRSFADGELTPAMFARTDALRYARGLRTCRNMIVQKMGGATNRPGLVYLNGAKDSTVACRLMRFVLDATDVTDTYVLEVGNGYIRFYQDGARVTVSSVAAWANTTAYTEGDLVSYLGANYYCIVDHTSVQATDRPSDGSIWNSKWYALTGSIYEIPTPYTTADLPDIQYRQYGDVITLVHPSYAVRELTRISSTEWTLDVVTFGPAIDAPENVAASGGTAGANTDYAVTAVMVGSLEESLPGLYTRVAFEPDTTNPITVTWDNVAGALSYNVYRSIDGGTTYALIKSAGGTPVVVTDTAWGDTSETATSAAAGVWVPAPGQMRNALAITATTKAYDGRYTVNFKYSLVAGAGGFGASGRVGFYYSRDGETRVFAGYSTVRTIAAPGTVAGSDEITIDVPDNGYAALTIDAVPEVEQLSGPAAVCTMNANTLTAPDNVASWSISSSSFADDGSVADDGQAPPTQEDLFNSVGAYPAAVGEYQQRRFLANTPARRGKVWGSRIGSRGSFAMSTPLQDDDTVAFTLVGDQAQVVKHMIDLRGLIVFTTAAVHAVGGNDAGEGGVITPASIRPTQVSEDGIGRLAPLKVRHSALYLETHQDSVLDLVPVQTSAGLGGYEGFELSVFSNHLFDGYTIVDWAYARRPFGVVWCVRSDGALLGLTYVREFGIWAWHRHDTDGAVENIIAVPEGREDAVYMVVNRTINGATARYIERMASRLESDIRDMIFMDAALTVDGRHTGTTTMTLSGGSTWDNTEQITLTASASFFVAGDVGNWVYFYDDDGVLMLRAAIEGYASGTVVTVRADRDVVGALQAVAWGNGSGSWGKAVVAVTGLSHLEGEEVAVLGDGFVLASPNNWTLDSNDVVVREYNAITVASGAIALPSPAVVVHVGLPYIGDLETLDLDGPGPRSQREAKKIVNAVGLFLQDSRGVWAGRPDKVATTDPLKGLDEMKPRESEGYDDPPALVTDYTKITCGGDWNTNGRVLVRQVDPLPITVLSISPIGYGT
jgi:hypothetical protein